jgi:hypothetical protein
MVVPHSTSILTYCCLESLILLPQLHKNIRSLINPGNGFPLHNIGRGVDFFDGSLCGLLLPHLPIVFNPLNFDPTLLELPAILLQLGPKFLIIKLLLLELPLQLYNRTLLPQPQLLSLPCPRQLLRPLLLELPIQAVYLVLLYQDLFVQIRQLVLVELQLLEVLHLQLQLVQLALHGLLLTEGCGVAGWGFAQ